MGELIRSTVFHCDIQQFRARMARLSNRLGIIGWKSQDGIRLVIGEYPYMKPFYAVLPEGASIPMGMYDWDPNEVKSDPIKRPYTRASWIVVRWTESSMRPMYHPQKGLYSAGIEVYEEADNQTRVDFLDGYDPARPKIDVMPLGRPFDEFIGVVLEEIGEMTEIKVKNKAKILFLAANPVLTSQLNLDEEIRAITMKIRASNYRDSLELISVWATRPDDLIQYLNEHQPQIVHFSGHGSTKEEIVLMDDNRKAKPVSTAALKMLFTTLKDNIRVVILNACYSQAQAEAITEAIDCAIGMNTTISDEAATVFVASFYRAIGFGRSVQEAFDQGKTALLLESIPEDQTPELLVKKNVSPSDLFLL